jgi:hypothetical protein
MVAETVIGMTRLPAPMKMTSRPPRPLEMPPLACIRSTIAAMSATSCVTASAVRGRGKNSENQVAGNAGGKECWPGVAEEMRFGADGKQQQEGRRYQEAEGV